MANPTLTPRLPQRSVGLKLLLICGLAGVMSIVALIVFLLLNDRTERASQVASEIGQIVGGPQAFLGPVLAVPYIVPAADPKAQPIRDVLVIFPIEGEATVDAKSEVRRRSLFKVPVYVSKIAFAGQFDLTRIADKVPQGAKLDWSRAEVVLGASDVRGAKAEVYLNVGGSDLAVAPSTILQSAPSEEPNGVYSGSQSATNRSGDLPLTYFGARPAKPIKLDDTFDVAAKMEFSGASRLSVLAFAKSTKVSARSDWPHPSFDGGFLPQTRTLRPDGFDAKWAVPFIARGIPVAVTSNNLASLEGTALGISFVELANPYQSVARSLKYAPLFLGLVFLAYFIFEVQQSRRVHAAQYLLVGFAQIVFYLLLLSLSEQIGFDLGFLISATATVGLISCYAGWVFESRRQGYIALATFSLLYALIYVLMRLEDFALLVGAFSSFVAIAAVMFFTRRIDWYGTPPTPSSVGDSKEIV